MTYPPQYPQQQYPPQPGQYPPGYPQAPQQYPPAPGQYPGGYPQQPQQYPPQPGQYPPQYPQQGYGGQGVAQPPAPTREQWSGGAVFDAKPMQEKRPTLNFDHAPIGAQRILVCDQDPIVIHGNEYQTDRPAYDANNEPKWTVGTGVIDEYGQPLTHWCGKWSKAAVQYTSARTAVGLGPEDSMIGWVTFIKFLGTVPAKKGDAKDYQIMLMDLAQGRQYLTQAQNLALTDAGIRESARPGNRYLQQDAPPAQPTAPVQPPAMQPQPMQPTYPPQQVPAGQYGQAPGMPPAQPGWPQAAPQYSPPAGMPTGFPQAPAATYGAAPQQAPWPAQPTPDMGQAVRTVQQTLGGQVIPQPGQPEPQIPQAPVSEVYGFRIDALAAYASMPDAVLASTGQDVNLVRAAIAQAQAMGVLPNPQ